jgi:hypothetical protein
MRLAPASISRYVGPPSTALGRWSVLLEAGSLVALGGLALLLGIPPQGGSPFLANPFLSLLLVVAAAAGVVAGVVSGVAIARRGERSLHDVLTLVLAVFLAWVAFAELARYA